MSCKPTALSKRVKGQPGSEASAFSIVIISYEGMLVIRNPRGSGQGFHKCPTYTLRHSGHGRQHKQAVSELIPARMLRTNASSCWFGMRVVIHSIYMSLRE